MFIKQHFENLLYFTVTCIKLKHPCSVETECWQAINILSLDFRFPMDNGSCSSDNTLTIKDDTLVNFTCTSNNNYLIFIKENNVLKNIDVCICYCAEINQNFLSLRVFECADIKLLTFESQPQISTRHLSIVCQ
jgi:hypothetical protein